jgi:hypothetical protein
VVPAPFNSTRDWRNPTPGPLALTTRTVGDSLVAAEPVRATANVFNFNDALRDHAEHADWSYAGTVAELHLWSDRLCRMVEAGVSGFNRNGFNLNLPTVALRIEKLHQNTLAKYTARNGLSITDEITFNERYLNNRPLAWKVWTLFHEIVHLMEARANTKPGKHPYHSNLFRKLAEYFGTPVNHHGQLLAVNHNGMFAALLREHNVNLTEFDAANAKKKYLPGVVCDSGGDNTKPGKLAKWVCPCNVTVRVAAGREFQAVCLECSQKFSRAKSAW